MGKGGGGKGEEGGVVKGRGAGPDNLRRMADKKAPRRKDRSEY